MGRVTGTVQTVRLTAGALLAAVIAISPRAIGLAADDLGTGRALYTELCAQCHGADLSGPGPAQLDLTRFPRDQRERFALAVTRGTRFMPPVGRGLRPDEVDALWAYVAGGAR